MRNRFVKITLILTMLLVVAAPTQAFAAEKNCNLNQFNALNTNISKIYSANPTNANKIAEQLQKLMQQFNGGNATTSKAAPAAPAAPANAAAPAPAAPAKNTVPAPAAPAKDTAPAAPSASAALGNYEQQVVDLVNKERASAGLPALKVNTKLAAVAEKKAEDLRDKNYFDHQSPTYGSPFDMMKQFGITYTSAGENIAKGQKTPQEVMNGWMNSPGHRANILNSSYTEIGVGYVTDSNGTTYWVQHFIRP